MIELTIEARDGRKALAFEPRHLVIAGWTGRDVAAEADVLSPDRRT